MKYLILLIYFFTTYFFYAQENNFDFHFKNPQPNGIEAVDKIDKSYEGVYYKKNDSLIKIIVTGDSIYIEFGIVLIYTEKEIEQNKKLYLSNSLLFGVVENSGLPYVNSNDTLYSLLLQTETIYKQHNKSELRKLDDKYYLSYQEKNYYYVRCFNFKANTLKIEDIDNTINLDLIQNIEDINIIKNISQNSYIINPSLSEFTNFVNNDGFTDVVEYYR